MPTFPGSLVPRAKITVYFVQAPPSWLYVSLTPVRSEIRFSNEVKTPVTAEIVPSMAGRYSSKMVKNLLRGVFLFSLSLSIRRATGEAAARPTRDQIRSRLNFILNGEA